MTTALQKLVKVNESFGVSRYDNGWMIEVSGRDKKSEYKTIKTICNTEEELLTIIKEYNSLEVDS